MKIKGEFLITKVDVKKKKDTNEQYLMVSMLDLNSGDVFDIIHKNIEDMRNLTPMTKMDIELYLSSSKYGLALSINNIGEVTGNI